MRVMGLIALVSFFSCGVPPMYSQAPAAKAAASDPKIAVVQFQSAVSATNEFQRDLADLRKKFQPKQTELKNLSGEIDQLTKQLRTDEAKLSEAEQQARARTIDKKKRDAQRVAEDDQNDWNQALQDLFARIAQKMGGVLDVYAKDHGFTLIVDRSERQDEAPVVLWASPSTEITRQVVDAYNAKSGVPAQATLPTAPQPSASR